MLQQFGIFWTLSSLFLHADDGIRRPSIEKGKQTKLESQRQIDYSPKRAWRANLPSVHQVDEFIGKWPLLNQVAIFGRVGVIGTSAVAGYQSWRIPVHNLQFMKRAMTRQMRHTHNGEGVTWTKSMNFTWVSWSKTEFHCGYGNLPVAISISVIPNDQTSLRMS